MKKKIKLESLNNSRFEVLNKSQMKYVVGGQCQRTDGTFVRDQGASNDYYSPASDTIYIPLGGGDFTERYISHKCDQISLPGEPNNPPSPTSLIYPEDENLYQY